MAAAPGELVVVDDRRRINLDWTNRTQVLDTEALTYANQVDSIMDELDRHAGLTPELYRHLNVLVRRQFKVLQERPFAVTQSRDFDRHSARFNPATELCRIQQIFLECMSRFSNNIVGFVTVDPDFVLATFDIICSHRLTLHPKLLPKRGVTCSWKEDVIKHLCERWPEDIRNSDHLHRVIARYVTTLWAYFGTAKGQGRKPRKDKGTKRPRAEAGQQWSRKSQT
jgi:hypothetical protein